MSKLLVKLTGEEQMNKDFLPQFKERLLAQMSPEKNDASFLEQLKTFEAGIEWTIMIPLGVPVMAIGVSVQARLFDGYGHM